MHSITAPVAAKIILAASALAVGQAKTAEEIKTGYAPVNGLKLYYEIRGTGKPLILLHGGLGSTELLGEVFSDLAKGHQVIAVDLQGHGRTADIERPMSSQAMADDIAALVKYLGLEKVDLMGYSLGGSVVLQTTIRHPELVRKLVVVSVPFKRSAWYPEVRAGMDQMGPAAAEMMKPSPLYKAYARIAPRPKDWVVLVTKLGDLIRKDYDWSKDIAAIKAPTMLVFGDADAVPPAHAAEFFALLGGGKKDAGWDGSGMIQSQLAILPGATHYNIFAAQALASTVTPFLDAPMPTGK